MVRADFAEVDVTVFEDGERVSASVEVAGRDVVVVQSLLSHRGGSVHDELCQLLFLLGTLRDDTAGSVTVMVPYLCYSRQDRPVDPLDPVATRHVARLTRVHPPASARRLYHRPRFGPTRNHPHDAGVGDRSHRQLGKDPSMWTVTAASTAARDEFASFDVPVWAWAVLVGTIAVLLLVDLLLVHRTPHVISFKEAAIESAVWVALGLAFVVVMLMWQGGPAAGEYFAGYLIEKSLSVDNVFVWAVLFSYFAVPPQYQFRVLFWGVFGALVMRAIFIFAGVALLEAFDWILYVFGAFLLLTAVKIARHSGSEVHPEKNPVLKVVRRVVPTTNHYDGQKLFTKENGRRVATPLFTVLVLVEATDVVFAVDSVPAILAVSREPFIVFASNAFAILGLRSLYFLLAGMAGRFRYLNVGLGVILGFVGIKMLLVEVYHLPVWLSLTVIAAILAVSIWASIRADRRQHGGGPDHEAPRPDQPHPSAEPDLADPSTAPADAQRPYLDRDQRRVTR